MKLRMMGVRWALGLTMATATPTAFGTECSDGFNPPTMTERLRKFGFAVKQVTGFLPKGAYYDREPMDRRDGEVFGLREDVGQDIVAVDVLDRDGRVLGAHTARFKFRSDILDGVFESLFQLREREGDLDEAARVVVRLTGEDDGLHRDDSVVSLFTGLFSLQPRMSNVELLSPLKIRTYLEDIGAAHIELQYQVLLQRIYENSVLKISARFPATLRNGVDYTWGDTRDSADHKTYFEDSYASYKRGHRRESLLESD